MFTLKTNTPVVVSSRTGEEAFVYMRVGSVTFQKVKNQLQYSVAISYEYPQTVNVGFDENDQPITKEIVVPLPAVRPTVFTQAQADGIEQMTGTLTGQYHTDRFMSLILAGINYKLDLPKIDGGHPYDLGSQGWTVL